MQSLRRLVSVLLVLSLCVYVGGKSQRGDVRGGRGVKDTEGASERAEKRNALAVRAKADEDSRGEVTGDAAKKAETILSKSPETQALLAAMQADHDINMQKAEDGVHASAGHARTKEQREARSKKRKELKEKKEEKEEKEEEEEAKAYEKMGDINHNDFTMDKDADYVPDHIKATVDAHKAKKDSEKDETKPKLDQSGLTVETATSMRKIMRVLRIYGKIHILDFFDWFTGMAGVAAIAIVSLVIQGFVPVSRPNMAWAGLAAGVFLGGAMLQGIPQGLGLLDHTELKPYEYYRRGDRTKAAAIILPAELPPMLKILAGVCFACFLETIQGGRGKKEWFGELHPDPELDCDSPVQSIQLVVCLHQLISKMALGFAIGAAFRSGSREAWYFGCENIVRYAYFELLYAIPSLVLYIHAGASRGTALGMVFLGDLFALVAVAGGIVEPKFTAKLPAAFLGPTATGMACYIALAGGFAILSEHAGPGILSGAFATCYGMGCVGLVMGFDAVKFLDGTFYLTRYLLNEFDSFVDDVLRLKGGLTPFYPHIAVGIAATLIWVASTRPAAAPAAAKPDPVAAADSKKTQ